MRVLLIAPVHREKEFLTQKGKYPFLRSQGQMGWVTALEELGHKVTVIRYTDSVLYPNSLRVGVDDVFKKHFPLLKNKFQRFQDKYYRFSFDNYFKNKHIGDVAEKIRPQVVILSGGAYCVFPETLKKIKEKYHVPVILFSGVNPTYGSPPAEKEMVQQGIIDMIIINDVGYGRNWERFGAKRVVVLPVSAVDRAIYKKLDVTVKEKKALSSDVCYVGSLTKDRQEKLVALKEFYLKIWGDIPPGTELDPRLKPFYQGRAHGEEMIKIYNSAKIVLNIHASDMKHGGNMRTFEIPATGAFQLIDNLNPEWFVDGKEVVSFHSVSDLQQKISYYLSHDDKRELIAESGYNRAMKDHTYKARFQKLFDLLNDRN